jgi:hypothetical protein
VDPAATFIVPRVVAVPGVVENSLVIVSSLVLPQASHTFPAAASLILMTFSVPFSK